MANKVFQLDVLRARSGDCTLLHYGTTQKPGLALIDGGHDDVYQPFLKPRLEQLREERGLKARGKPLPIDLMMLSHIDADHVAGLLELTAEILEPPEDDGPIFRVLNLWHNTFDDVIDNDADELADAVSERFGPASLNGHVPADILDNLEDSAIATVSDTVMVVASVPQGHQLRQDAVDIPIERNIEAGGGFIMASDETQQLDMGKGLQFTVVGPMFPEVKKLQTEIRTWLRKHPSAQNRLTASALASLADNSPSNLSSIVVLAEVEKSAEEKKRILFTGDALGAKILKGLELVGLIDEGGSIRVDVLKVQHHGSDRNVTPEFFERVIADHYVFSGNGQHGNPERATLEMLAEARGDDRYTIHLTYPVDEIDVERKKDWDTNRADEERRKLTKPSVKVRAKWSKAKQSLAAFLDKNPDVADRIEIVEDGVLHTIDLLK